MTILLSKSRNLCRSAHALNMLFVKRQIVSILVYIRLFYCLDRLILSFFVSVNYRSFFFSVSTTSFFFRCQLPIFSFQPLYLVAPPIKIRPAFMVLKDEIMDGFCSFVKLWKGIVRDIFSLRLNCFYFLELDSI